MKDITKIRNFSIIAHIDHGKSTLADRLIQRTGGLTEREMTHGQILDNMEIEQERGITIKAQTVRLEWNGYELNLMDTPGHVDFAYEVSRSLAACEGALLVVDAAQGVEAQTLANVYQSIEHDHEIVPVINKIDLPAAEPEKVRAEIEEVIGLDASNAVLASAKTGIGIDDEQGALAGGEAAAHLIGEVDMAGRVHQVQLIAVPGEAHRLRLDGDPAFALDVHVVEHLLVAAHLAVGHAAGRLDQPVGERRLAVVDVRDDAEVTDAVDFLHLPRR